MHNEWHHYEVTFTCSNQFILCTQTVVHLHLLVVWCHHLPYLPCQILVLQHIFGFITAKTIPYLPSQSLADSLLPRDAFTCTMLSHPLTQDKEDVNTKIDGPHSGLSPSLFFIFFPILLHFAAKSSSRAVYLHAVPLLRFLTACWRYS